jgi:hypothetical protein
MARIKLIKTNFTSGEITPELLGRGELAAYTNGASKLRNVRIISTGGARRRPGFRHVATVLGKGRFVPFEFNTEQVYLLVFTDGKIEIHADDALVATLDAPWSETDIPSLSWTQSADELLLTHPDVPPKKLTRTGPTEWSLTDWTFFTDEDRVHQPYYKFADEAVTLTPSGTSGSITLSASADVFDAAHVGTRFRIADKEVEITAVASATSATASVKETLSGTSATKDWEEAAFSPMRGYPASCCFHQDRLVIGGSRALTNRLWLSKSADLYNFDLGTAEDDEAIEFAILSDQVNAVRAVFSGRHLQVFTTGSEWMVTGDPLTPGNIQLKRQTRVGSPIDRSVPPRDVDGATLFISRNGRELREFLFADVEQAYQSNDLAMLTEDMLTYPVDQDFNKRDRTMYVVNGGTGPGAGTLASVTIHRQEKVTAWTRLETDGVFESVAVVGDDLYALVERDGTRRIEKLDAALSTDAAATLTAPEPTVDWAGLDHLDGMTVEVIADGIVRNKAVVTGGALSLDEPATAIEIGLPFTHRIEPLPIIQPGGTGAGQGSAMRLVKATFRLLETAALSVDTGQGLRALPFKRIGESTLDTPIVPITGDKSVRSLGWTRGEPVPLWRIEQSDPLPCTVLSVLTEVSING